MAKIAVMGYGVVGSGVVELFYKNKKSIEQKAGEEIDIKYILDVRDFQEDQYKEKFTKNVMDIINDEEVSAVAECMGGVMPAFDYVKSLLEKGKSVSSSNKELVAEKGADLLKIAKEHNCNFFFEASVGGAIPIIRPIHKCLAANEITEISGILNGTTNFILTKMINDKMSFDSALSMAQELGYAEKNPAADVEGQDACRKICILSSLAFGKHVYPKSVYTRGIKGISLEDVQFADIWGGAVKLIASVKKLSDGTILPIVMPMIVPYSNLISRVDDVFNAVMVSGDGIDKTMFYGRGAGKLPTASAVVADIIEAVKHTRTVFSQYWEDSADDKFIADHKEFAARMYFRVEKTENLVLDDGTEFIENPDTDQMAFITEEITLEVVDMMIGMFDQMGIKVLSTIPVLEVE